MEGPEEGNDVSGEDRIVKSDSGRQRRRDEDEEDAGEATRKRQGSTMKGRRSRGCGGVWRRRRSKRRAALGRVQAATRGRMRGRQEWLVFRVGRASWRQSRQEGTAARDEAKAGSARGPRQPESLKRQLQQAAAQSGPGQGAKRMPAGEARISSRRRRAGGRRRTRGRRQPACCCCCRCRGKLPHPLPWLSALRAVPVICCLARGLTRRGDKGLPTCSCPEAALPIAVLGSMSISAPASMRVGAVQRRLVCGCLAPPILFRFSKTGFFKDRVPWCRSRWSTGAS